MSGKRKPSLDLDLLPTYPPTPEDEEDSDEEDGNDVVDPYQRGGKVAFSITNSHNLFNRSDKSALFKSINTNLQERLSDQNSQENRDASHQNEPPIDSGRSSRLKSKRHASKSKQTRRQLRTKSKTWESITFPPVPTFPEYELVNSPDDASSTSSSEYSSTYVRTPGFDHHGHTFVDDSRLKVPEDVSDNEEDHEDVRSRRVNTPLSVQENITCKKKKSSVFSNKCDKKKISNDGRAVQSSTLVRPKPKKYPLPMKLRALPQSFWQQPNNTNVLSPGAVYPILPPLPNNSRELTPPEDRHEGIVSDANTDLLFSLFHGVEAEQRKIQGKPQVTVVKRGRPKKAPSTLSKTALKDEDPCLVSSVTEAILPLLPPEKIAPNSLQARIAEGQQVLAMVSLNGDRSNISLPILNVDHNYSQILSELVVQL